jgi:hypothetical protein
MKRIFPAWSMRLKLPVLVILCAVLFSLVQAAGTGPVSVTYTGEDNAPKTDEKFTNIDTVLKQLEETLTKPELWGDFWDEKVPMSGTFTNYRFKEIAPDLAKYLTDGSLTIQFKENKIINIGKSKAQAAAQTVNRNKIILFQVAGMVPGKKKYSDFYLASTILHELMHVWQYDKWTAVGRTMNIHDSVNAVEPKLPKDLFSTTEIDDPGGSLPVPNTSSGQVIQKSSILLFDASQSMGENNKIQNAKTAAKNAVQDLNDQNEVALIVFYDCGSIVAEVPFTTDHSKVIEKIDTIQPTGSTPLADAMDFAEDYKKNARSDNRVIVMFTDGIETCRSS